MIKLSNYSVTSKTKGVLVDAVELQLKQGETLGIVGESGSGKSITALGLLGLIESNDLSFSGKMQLFDETYNIGTENWRELICKHFGKNIGVIYQDPMTALHPTIKCEKQLKEAIFLDQLDGEVNSHILNMLQKVGLDTGCLKKYPFQLSGGQQQRVMIAMAMINGPKLIVADEPNTALDKASSDKIAKLISDLKLEINASLILISHDIEFVGQMADQIAVMHHGKFVEKGSCSKIINKAEHPYTKALLACKPKVENKHLYLAEIDDFLEGKTVDKIPVLAPQKVRLKAEKILPVYGKDKNKFYPLSKALGFEIESSKTLGLVGGSGSGKSSVAKCLVGWNQSEGGKISLEGKTYNFPVKSWPEIRREIQYVFQDPYGSLNPSKNIEAQLCAPYVNNKLGKYEQAKKKAEELIEEVGLKVEDLKKYPHAFSGGQRQRIVIARALMLNPSVLICDESVSALDLSVQAKILNLLKRLQIKLGLSILFISHDKDVIAYFCDEVISL